MLRVLIIALTPFLSGCGTPPAAAASCPDPESGDEPLPVLETQTTEVVVPADADAGGGDVRVSFAFYALRVVVWPIGAGTVERDPDKPLYLSGTRVHLDAVPVAGWRFVEWRGDLESEENGVDVVVDEYTTLAAHFAPAE